MGPSTSLSEQGQTRLVIIREALSMDPDTPAGDIQLFLGNNISLIRHLVFGTVPHPDWQYRSGPELFEMRVWNRASHARNCRLWSAITGVYWEDVRIRDVMDMALHQMAGQNGWLLTRALRKTRRDTLPGELRTRLLAEEPGFGVQERLRFEEIGRKRRNRPGSLLREAVPQDE